MKKALFRNIFILFFTIFFAGIDLSAEDRAKIILNDELFRIISRDAGRKYVETIRNETRNHLRRLQQQYGISPDSFIIIIAADEKEFKDKLHPDFPHWGIAAAKYSESSIILKAPKFSRQSMEELNTTLAHELVHLALLPLIRDKYFPRWINEGFAQYFAGQQTFRNRILLGQQAAFNSFPSLSRIDEVLKFDQRKANAAYAQSLSAITYLFDEFGTDDFRHFLTLLQETYYDDAFEKAYGFDEALYDMSWRRYAVKKYRPFILLDLYSWLWAAAPILVMLAWWRKKRHARLIHEQWEIMDELEKDFKNPPSLPN